jgi:ketosteroid isomerase-like protein
VRWIGHLSFAGSALASELILKMTAESGEVIDGLPIGNSVSPRPGTPRPSKEPLLPDRIAARPLQYAEAWKRTMTRRAVLILTVVIAPWSAGLWAQSMGQKSVLSDPAEEIRALEIARNVAIAHGDVSALDKMTSDDYTFINVGGQLHTKAEFLKEFATNAFKYEYRQIYDLKIRVYGDAAVVTGRSVQTVQENGKDYGAAYRFTRVYIRQKGHWLSVALQTTHVDGQ